MDKVKISYIVDICILISFLVVAVTGILKFPAFELWNVLPNMKFISWLHDWSGVAAIIFAFFHVALSWKTLVALTKRYFGKKSKNVP